MHQDNTRIEPKYAYGQVIMTPLRRAAIVRNIEERGPTYKYFCSYADGRCYWWYEDQLEEHKRGAFPCSPVSPFLGEKFDTGVLHTEGCDGDEQTT